MHRRGALTCTITVFPYNFSVFLSFFGSKYEQKFHLRHYMPELMSKIKGFLRVLRG